MEDRNDPHRDGKRKAVDTSLAPEFAAAVFAVVAAVPEGELASDGEIDRQAGFPGYASHVGRLMSASRRTRDSPGTE